MKPVVRSWAENPYWQYFCGYDFLQWDLPIDSSSLTRWRQRLGEERLEKLLKMTVKVSVSSGVVKKKELSNIVADTTVMPKSIEFPTDAKLLSKARARLVKSAKANGIKLRQNYNLVAKKLAFKIGRYFHAKQMKRVKKAQRSLRTIVGRVMRDCQRKDFSRRSVDEKVFRYSETNRKTSKSETKRQE